MPPIWTSLRDSLVEALDILPSAFLIAIIGVVLGMQLAPNAQMNEVELIFWVTCLVILLAVLYKVGIINLRASHWYQGLKKQR